MEGTLIPLGMNEEQRIHLLMEAVQDYAIYMLDLMVSLLLGTLVPNGTWDILAKRSLAANSISFR